jgi:hypothetical protein
MRICQSYLAVDHAVPVLDSFAPKANNSRNENARVEQQLDEHPLRKS